MYVLSFIHCLEIRLHCFCCCFFFKLSIAPFMRLDHLSTAFMVQSLSPTPHLCFFHLSSFFFPVFVLFCFCLLFCCFSITKMIAKVGHVISLSRAISHAIGRYRKRIKLVLLTSLSSLAQAFGKGPLKSNFSLFVSKLTNCL